jgi:uncharacterized protein YcfJ
MAQQEICMNTLSKVALAAAVLACAGSAAAQVTLYEHVDFGGQSYTASRSVGDFTRIGFNDKASSVIVTRERWELCDDAGFAGRCVVLQPGRYPSLVAMGLNDRVSSMRPAAAAPPPRAARVTLYENEGFGGRSFSTETQVDSFARVGFNDRASSIVVENARWQVCEDDRFGGRCVVLGEGRYASLAAMGLNDRVSSLRLVDPNTAGTRVDDRRYSTAPGVDYGRRDNERLFEANVTDVRQVMGTPEQRCWVEPGQAAPQRGAANVPGAIAGALLGGVIGHQIGGGFGRDIATIGGVAAGAAVGAQVGRDRDGQPVATQDVRRCSTVPGSARTEYWDVTYSFRGQEHRMQMTHAPGATVTVNRQGEPRV